MIHQSLCEDCGDKSYHIPLTHDSITYDPEVGFTLHLDEEEFTDLYYQIKEVKEGTLFATTY